MFWDRPGVLHRRECIRFLSCIRLSFDMTRSVGAQSTV